MNLSKSPMNRNINKLGSPLSAKKNKHEINDSNERSVIKINSRSSQKSPKGKSESASKRELQQSNSNK